MKKQKILLIILTILCISYLVSCKKKQNIQLSITSLNEQYIEGDSIIIDIDITKKTLYDQVQLIINDNIDYQQINNVIIPLETGQITVKAKYKDIYSNEISLNITPSIYQNDPYIDIEKEKFYYSYNEAINPKDAFYRTLHGLISGQINTPNQTPEKASYMPKEKDLFIRNIQTYYSSNKDTYYIIDGYGEIVDMVFKSGGYIGLDEVASYLIAYGNVPTNYATDKTSEPQESIWGKYLRLNHSYFSGNTKKYPYEPQLPNISGCGGSLKYYEIDFGTTGTDCDPNYETRIYNDGQQITRGAARLVYARFENNNPINDITKKYVFYTYNHYNDFEEYLNYQGGWGEKFGNITGGGELSSKKNFRPTPYKDIKNKLINNNNLKTNCFSL